MTALLRKAGALAPLLLASMSLNQQTQGPPQETSAIGTAFILGRTVDGSTGKPIGGAIVSLNASGGVPNAAAIPGAPPAALSRFPIRSSATAMATSSSANCRRAATRSLQRRPATRRLQTV
jgi:hypothetical protein